MGDCYYHGDFSGNGCPECRSDRESAARAESLAKAKIEWEKEKKRKEELYVRRVNDVLRVKEILKNISNEDLEWLAKNAENECDSYHEKIIHVLKGRIVNNK